MQKKSNKLSVQSGGEQATMSDIKKPTTQATGVVYPDKTTGSETAALARKEANRWSENKRSELFNQGMQIIYGGTGPKEKVRSR